MADHAINPLFPTCQLNRFINGDIHAISDN